MGNESGVKLKPEGEANARMRTSCVGVLPIVLGATALGVLVGTTNVEAVVADTIEVSVSVDYGDASNVQDRQVNDRLLSYVRRELRDIGDVVMTEARPSSTSPANVKITVLGISLQTATSEDFVGHAFTVGAFTRYRETFGEAWELADHLEEDSVAFNLLVDLYGKANTVKSDYWKEDYRMIGFVPAEGDLLREIRGIVATIDTNIFEELRSPEGEGG